MLTVTKHVILQARRPVTFTHAAFPFLFSIFFLGYCYLVMSSAWGTPASVWRGVALRCVLLSGPTRVCAWLRSAMSCIMIAGVKWVSGSGRLLWAARCHDLIYIGFIIVEVIFTEMMVVMKWVSDWGGWQWIIRVSTIQEVGFPSECYKVGQGLGKMN